MRSVHPDAFGMLRRGEALWSFFLEWERRAVGPVTMEARLAPYLRYYSSHRPTDDHGAGPSVLVVFDDDIAPTHFLRVAKEGMDRARVAVSSAGLPSVAGDPGGAPGTGLACPRMLGARLPGDVAPHTSPIFKKQALPLRDSLKGGNGGIGVIIREVLSSCGTRFALRGRERKRGLHAGGHLCRRAGVVDRVYV